MAVRTGRKARKEVTPSKWASLLTDADLQSEILTLGAKCKSPVYRNNMAGKLHQAALTEHRRREKQKLDQQLAPEVIMAGYRDEIRKLRGVLRDWHKFMDKLSKSLGCLGDHDTVVMRVDELVKRCPPVCSRCGGAKVIWSVPKPPKHMGTVKCPDCDGTGVKRKGKRK